MMSDDKQILARFSEICDRAVQRHGANMPKVALFVQKEIDAMTPEFGNVKERLSRIAARMAELPHAMLHQ